ncbi:MAG: glutathione S-transferase family protein [Gammaproteobacteria bacterium]|jgi:glutathione S-transferase|nr:MAG: glutathione S-transferase family protein [Gammaproteobacteria bacterium]
MLKLHGMSRSNYYNLAKACLAFKGISFEEVKAVPSQEEDYLAKSPMGKVPCIETDQGFVSETLAIAEYLDAIQPEKPLLPSEPFARAKTLELIRHIELDIELVARRVLPAAFFGATASDELKETTKKDLDRGVKAVSRLFVCDPYASGNELNLADLYTYYSFGLASAVVQTIYQEDLLAELPQVKALMGRLADEEPMRTLEAAAS